MPTSFLARLRAQGFSPTAILDLNRWSTDAEAGARLLRVEAGPGGAGEPLPSLRETEAALDGTALRRADGRPDLARLIAAARETQAPPDAVLLPLSLAGEADAAALAEAGIEAFALVAEEPGDPDRWLGPVRAAFDAGYVTLRGGAPGGEGLAFLRSGLVRDLDGIGWAGRGTVAMSSLGSNGRFGNQLFQYAYTRFYGLRHGLLPAVPEWRGARLYGREDASPEGLHLPELRFYAFDNDDLALWRLPNPPSDVDLWGYFQELPACWRPHRALLRRLFALRPDLAQPLDERLSALTEGGGRPLVAVHVRRGDYVTLHRKGLPWYRPVPEAWYLAWLDTILAGLDNPVLYVGTDEPGTVLPHFAHLHPVTAEAIGAPNLPPDIADFEVMRRAGHLAIANSSFSRMAAILAADDQVCACPDFTAEAFQPYQPWIDEDFWGRFEGEDRASPTFGYGPDAREARAIMVRVEASAALLQQEADRQQISDLQSYLGQRDAALRESEAVKARLLQQVGELQEYLRQREAALHEGESVRSRLVRQVAELQEYLGRTDAALRESEAVKARLLQQVGELQEYLRQQEAALHEGESVRSRLVQQVGELQEYLGQREAALREGEAAKDHLRRQIGELQDYIRRKEAALQHYQAAMARLRQQIGALEEDRAQGAAALAAAREEQRALAQALEDRIATLEAEARRDSALIHQLLDPSRMSAQDYAKLMLFWPVGRSLGKLGRAARPWAGSLANEADALTSLIGSRQYRAFAGRLATDVARAPRWALRRTARHLLGRDAASSPGNGSAQAGDGAPIAPSGDAAAASGLSAIRLDHETPAAFVGVRAIVEGESPATLATLERQTLRPRLTRTAQGSPPATDLDEMVCLLAPGVSLDPVAVETMAAALWAAPGVSFVVASGRRPGEEAGAPAQAWAACILHGRVWHDILGVLGSAGAPSPAQAMALLPALAERSWNACLDLSLPVGVWEAEPASAWSSAGWPALRPAREHFWQHDTVEGAERVEALVSSLPRAGLARPHLLVVVPWLPVGGSETVLLEVLERLAHAWHLSIVTTVPDTHDMRAAFARLTDEIYHLGDVFEPWRIQGFVSGLVRARGTRTLLTSNSELLYRCAAELKADHPDLTLVDILHNDLAAGHIRSAVLASTAFDRHIAISHRVGRALVARGVPPEQVAVIPNGIDADLFHPDTVGREAARERFGVGDGSLVLAFVGRFSPEKRPEAFVEIVAQVRQAHPVRAIMVGEGDGAEIRRRIEQEGLPITLVPKMPRAEIVHLYAAADLLVLTSTIEGMPMVVLEAMATGCPVAVTDVGDLRRIVETGRTGFVAPVEHPEHLAGMIIAAAGEPGRLAGMREAARAAILEADMTKRAMLDGYVRVLGSGQDDVEAAA